MSEYRNFIKDFPSRCSGILKDYESKRIIGEGKEVTLMLSIAASGLIVPYKRLSDDKHPSFDQKEYAKALGQFNDLMCRPFLGSTLWPYSSPGSWRTDTLPNVKSKPNFGSLDTSAKPIDGKKTTKEVTKRVRDALAHGNIFTRGNPVQKVPIDELIFLTFVDWDHKTDFVVYMISVDDFRSFLSNWFAFLATLDIPGDVPIAGELVKA